jgi:thiamine phosphate synthase YjbQ (UPF0047 family)
MVMKRSKFIKKALNHTSNTVCVNEEQVGVMLDIFEKLGVLPPETKATPKDFTHIDFTVNRWDEE